MRVLLTVIDTPVKYRADHNDQQVEQDFLPNHVPQVVWSRVIEKGVAVSVRYAILELTPGALDYFCFYKDLSEATAVPLMFTKARFDQLFLIPLVLIILEIFDFRNILPASFNLVLF